MTSKENTLAMLDKKLREFYKERNKVKKILRKTRKFIQKEKKFTPKSSYKKFLQNDSIFDSLSFIEFYISKIDYYNNHIIQTKDKQIKLFNNLHDIKDISEIDYYYPPVCIDSILNRYDEKAAGGCFFLVLNFEYNYIFRKFSV